jgi:hypothetical protein
MAVFVEIYLSDIEDEPDGASIKITNDADSLPSDVVAAFKDVYTGMLAAIDEIDAAEAAAEAAKTAPPAVPAGLPDIPAPDPAVPAP